MKRQCRGAQKIGGGWRWVGLPATPPTHDGELAQAVKQQDAPDSLLRGEDPVNHPTHPAPHSATHQGHRGRSQPSTQAHRILLSAPQVNVSPLAGDRGGRPAHGLEAVPPCDTPNLVFFGDSVSFGQRRMNAESAY